MALRCAYVQLMLFMWALDTQKTIVKRDRSYGWSLVQFNLEKNFLIGLKLSHDTKEVTTTHSASRIEGSDFLLGKTIAFRNHNSYMDEIFP